MKHSSKEQPSTMMIKLGYNFLKKRYFFTFKIHHSLKNQKYLFVLHP